MNKIILTLILIIFFSCNYQESFKEKENITEEKEIIKTQKWLDEIGVRYNILQIKSLGGALSLENKQIIDEELVHLKPFKNLEVLNLAKNKITDFGLVHLKFLKNLKELDLYGNQITDAGLIHLKFFKNLQILYLGNNHITDVGIIQLKTLTKLHLLSLMDTKVTEKGIHKLKKIIPKCKIFYNNGIY